MRALFRKPVFAVVLLFFFAAFANSNPASTEQTSPDLNAFAQQLADKHKFDKDAVLARLAKANKRQPILDAIARPWEAKPWFKYHPIFLTEKRVNAGVKFWNEHQTTLTRAEQALGVPAEIIVAIIGVETFYGTYKGKYSVLDALYTLGFYYPPRAKFFKSELEQLFLLADEEGLPIDELKGSYAGAMGWGQFISSSYRHYAIDFDDDGIRDLLNNPVDAIGSVANYFKKHGWQSGQPVAVPAQVSGKNHKALLSKSLKYKHKWQDLQNAGVNVEQASTDKEAPAKLLEFELENGHEYWVGWHNFYVITRYNHSPLYAMAVYQLSQQIKQAKGTNQ